MASWSDILGELDTIKTDHDTLEAANQALRQRYLRKLAAITGRNTLTYYSGWMARGKSSQSGAYNISDEDKNGFMNAFSKMDLGKGLDVILHSPGGDVASAESIIHYVRQMFADDVRAIVPQISMSGGTILALMGRVIVMGKQSNLGPIDPQLKGLSAQSVLEEFDRARRDIAQNPNAAALWQPILNKYHPTLLSQCENTLKWSLELAENTLLDGMLKGQEPDAAKERARHIATMLCDDDMNYMHIRHIHRDRCREIGLEIVDLEDDEPMRDTVMSVHNASLITFQTTSVIKIIESDQGETMQKTVYNKYRGKN